MATDKRFVVLSGPSGIGKGSLQRAINRLHPGLLAARPVLHTSRKKRPGEREGVDYKFQTADEILSLKDDPRYVVAPVRSDVQAIDLQQIEKLLDDNDLVFAEVFYTFGESLKDRATARGFTFKSVFLSPLPPGVPAADIVSVMSGKLTRRATDAPEKIRERALSAPTELSVAESYTHRLVDTAGEDDIAQWGEFGVCYGIPGSRDIKAGADLGLRARWLVETFVQIISCKIDPMPTGTWLPKGVGSLEVD